MREPPVSTLRVPPQSAPVTRSPVMTSNPGRHSGIEASTILDPRLYPRPMDPPWSVPYGPTGGFVPDRWRPRVTR